ncbi:MAG: DUF3842 family protein [Tissierella sp.]|nr:DUF3842 family protein [Tissierella sp.]
MSIAVVDGQGGGIGANIVEKLKTQFPDINIIALGTNSIATGKMLKAGANQGATGENAVIYNVNKVDIIMGVVAILMPNAMLGELSPRMAEAIGSSNARKILIPLEKCNIRVAMPGDYNVGQCVDYSMELVKNQIMGNNS